MSSPYTSFSFFLSLAWGIFWMAKHMLVSEASEGYGGLECCSPWGHEALDTTKQQQSICSTFKFCCNSGGIVLGASQVKRCLRVNCCTVQGSSVPSGDAIGELWPSPWEEPGQHWKEVWFGSLAFCISGRLHWCGHISSVPHLQRGMLLQFRGLIYPFTFCNVDLYQLNIRIRTFHCNDLCIHLCKGNGCSATVRAEHCYRQTNKMLHCLWSLRVACTGKDHVVWHYHISLGKLGQALCGFFYAFHGYLQSKQQSLYSGTESYAMPFNLWGWTTYCC